MKNQQHSQRGLGIISALFFITVVALLTVAITRSVATSAESYTQDILSLRAFLAAESGAQLGVHALFPPLGTGVCNNRSVSMSSIGLNSCDAQISCSSETVGSSEYYTIESSGRCLQNGQVLAQRTIVVRAR